MKVGGGAIKPIRPIARSIVPPASCEKPKGEVVGRSVPAVGVAGMALSSSSVQRLCLGRAIDHRLLPFGRPPLTHENAVAVPPQQLSSSQLRAQRYASVHRPGVGAEREGDFLADAGIWPALLAPGRRALTIVYIILKRVGGRDHIGVLFVAAESALLAAAGRGADRVEDGIYLFANMPPGLPLLGLEPASAMP